MVTTQDSSIGFGVESAFRTGVTPTRWLEFVSESLMWNKSVKQGQGLRVGARVERSARRVVPTADGGGDFIVEAISKGMGLLWQACLGAGSSTLVSGSTQQQLFTLGDTPPSLTVQKGLVRTDGTVDPYTFLGCTVDSWEFTCPNGDIATLKATIDAADLVTATAYAAPSYATAPVNLFHFGGGSVSTGVLTAPTTTVLGGAATPTANVRSFSVACNNNTRKDRFNFGAGGRKSKQIPGLRQITGKLEIEYDQAGYRDLVLNDGALCVVLTLTAGALSTGTETLQVVLPEVKLDGDLPAANGADMIVQAVNFKVLDNLTAAQPIWVVTRTADASL